MDGILLEPSLNADVSCIISCLDRPDQQTEKQESESESMKSNAIQLFRRLHFFAQDTEAVTLLGDEPRLFYSNIRAAAAPPTHHQDKSWQPPL